MIALRDALKEIVALFVIYFVFFFPLNPVTYARIAWWNWRHRR